MIRGPLTLAIETSTPFGSVAIGNGADTLADVAVGIGNRHAEALLPAVDLMLRTLNLRMADIERITVGAGPGSFTGLRVAASAAKGFAHALGVPLFAYSGLLALAASAGFEVQPVCGLFDARRDEVYAACYDLEDGALRVLLEPGARRIDEVLEAVDATRVLFAGDGAMRHAGLIENAGGKIAAPHRGVPRASALLWLTERMPDEGAILDPAEWEPAYMRESGAERGVKG